MIAFPQEQRFIFIAHFANFAEPQNWYIPWISSGHSVSYLQVEEIDTALRLQKMELSRDDIPLIANIYQNVFTTLAYDNIDWLEETVSGAGTSQQVNGIAVQAKVIRPQRISH